ncbi:MAG: DUF1993 domain-containing protein [Rickettsiales bacterium]
MSLYQASIPVFQHQLKVLSDILTIGQKDAEARKIDPSVYLNARLAPDMLPLTRQVQITSDTVKAGAARLAGAESPSFPDDETTFEALQDRIKKTLAYLETLKPAQIDGQEGRDITVSSRSGKERKFKGHDYLYTYALPNLFFHITTAYALLRHNGVPLGKADFLGAR